MANSDAVQPLAQTFKNSSVGGCFLTSIDLYFAAKDATIPVWVEIRNVVSGAPGKKVLPHSRKIIEPSNVFTDFDNGETPTRFTFDSPVYCQEGQEYAIVVMTKSLDYRLWTAQMGSVDVATGALVSSQPALGVLYKSSNDSAWTPVQNEDLKFKLQRAYFEWGVTGKVELENEIIGEAVAYADDSDDTIGTAYGKKLRPNPIILTNSSTVLRVNHIDHGMYSTSNNVEIRNVKSLYSTTLNGAITISATSLVLDPSTIGGSSVTGFEASNESSKIYLKIGNEIMKGTLSSLNVTSITRAQGSTTRAAHADEAIVELYQINKTPLTEINKVHTSISNINIDSYTVALTTAPTVSGSSDTIAIGGNDVYASENYRYETIRTNIAKMELPNTQLTAVLGSTSGTSPSGTETSFVKSSDDRVDFVLNENINLDRSNVVASDRNEQNEMASEKSLSLDLNMYTSQSSISPVIDLDKSNAILIANRVNNIDSSSDVYPTTDYNASTELVGDNNAAVYITKKVSLENPATSIKVTFAAMKTATSDIKVLFKVLRSDDSFDFDELGYEFFNSDGSPDSTVNFSLKFDDFQDYVYSAGIKDDGVGETLGEFSQFSIKIVMQGTNAAEPPRIRDLRIIALAT